MTNTIIYPHTNADHNVTAREVYEIHFAREAAAENDAVTMEQEQEVADVAKATRRTAKLQGMSDERLSEIKMLAYEHAHKLAAATPMRLANMVAQVTNERAALGI